VATPKLFPPRRPKLVLTRSLPQLCGSLGAAPGCDLRTGPDVHAMGRKWPMLKHGWRFAEDSAIFAFEPEDNKPKKDKGAKKASS